MMVAVAAAVGAGLRLKRRHLPHARPQAGQHFLQHRIGADAQEAVAHLRLRVAVPEVESATQQRMRIAQVTL
jgi:hypothetical protein